MVGHCQVSLKTSIGHKGMKEMFYLMTLSTHFTYSYMSSDVELTQDGTVLFNDTLNTFY